MLVQTIEKTRSSSAKRRLYLNVFAFLFLVMLTVKTVWFSGTTYGPDSRVPVDFDAFYLAAQLVWRGEIGQAYHFVTLIEMYKVLSSTDVFLPWTYPPPFNILIAPLALLPIGVAYGIFTTVTFIAYIATLKRIAGDSLALVLILIFPVLCITIACGQNGFLTGTLIGLACLGLQNRLPTSGVPLGLMIIKPHLAVAFAVYTLASRLWVAALVAIATAAGASILATILLGPGVWADFLHGLKESRVYLDRGFYPLYRMISPYAALRTFGIPAAAALVVQVLIGILALGIVCLSIRRGLTARQSLGMTAVATVLISPYAYDYDLPVLGVGLALILPDIIRLGSERERAFFYALTFLSSVVSMVQIARLLSRPEATDLTVGENMPVSLAGLTLIALLVLSWRILERGISSTKEHNSSSVAGSHSASGATSAAGLQT